MVRNLMFAAVAFTMVATPALAAPVGMPRANLSNARIRRPRRYALQRRQREVRQVRNTRS